MSSSESPKSSLRRTRGSSVLAGRVLFWSRGITARVGRSGVINPIGMMVGVGVDVGVSMVISYDNQGVEYTIYDCTGTIVYYLVLIFQF